MADFFPDVLDKLLTPVFLEGVRKKFHYEDAQAMELQAVAEEMLPLVREEAFWERKEFLMKSSYRTEISDATYESVAMSLGKGVDCLQEDYSDRGLLSQSYMIEVLASELLMQGYAAYNGYIRRNTRWHVARYHFIGGEEFPLEMLPQLLRELTRRITCNSAFCMLPKKSVIFLAELTQDEGVYCKGVCVGCNREHCPNRIADNCLVRRHMTEMTDMPLTYGYSRIFGVG